jgi:hypothetical protein
VLAEFTESLSQSLVLPMSAAAQGISSQLRLETFMNEPGTPVGDGAGADPDRANPAPPTPLMTIDDAQEVAELCALAGCPERTAAYLATRTMPTKVRSQLLNARADSPEITSRIVPDATHPTPQSLNENPLVMAARARAGKEN